MTRKPAASSTATTFFSSAAYCGEAFMAFAQPISFAVPEALQVSLGIGRTVKRDAVIVKVETDEGLTIMLTTRRSLPFSLNQFTYCGLDPLKYKVLVAKGVNAPLAAYRPICPTIIRVNTPGVTTADMKQLTFHHRRKPMYPFEPEMVWNGELTLK